MLRGRIRVWAKNGKDLQHWSQDVEKEKAKNCNTGKYQKSAYPSPHWCKHIWATLFRAISQKVIIKYDKFEE